MIPDAVAVQQAGGVKLGNVPRAANTPVARLVDQGRPARAEIVGMPGIGRAGEILG